MKKFKLPPLSRGWKVIRNLALTAVVLVFVWGLTDFYINDPYLSFRRAERANWVGPSEIQAVFRVGTNRMRVGTYQDQVLIQEHGDSNRLTFLPRKEEINLIPEPGHYGRIHATGPWVLAVDVPEEAALAQLRLETACYYAEEIREDGESRQFSPVLDVEWRLPNPKQWEKTYAFQGEFLEDGGVLFRLPGEFEIDHDIEQLVLGYAVEESTYNDPPEVRGIDCTMKAIFYNEEGREVGRAELSSPY